MAKEFTKFDNKKPRYELIHPKALDELAKILTHGAKKYDDSNWHKCPNWTRYFGACMRHMWAWLGGEDLDKESGFSHLGHAMCCIMFLISFKEISPERDDRIKLKQKNDHK